MFSLSLIVATCFFVNYIKHPNTKRFISDAYPGQTIIQIITYQVSDKLAYHSPDKSPMDGVTHEPDSVEGRHLKIPI